MRNVGTRAAGVTIACILVAAMAILFQARIRSLFPLGNDLEPSGDDWWTYHRYAVSVMHDGLSMPAWRAPTPVPAGHAGRALPRRSRRDGDA